jgi:hypothetical protein
LSAPSPSLNVDPNDRRSARAGDSPGPGYVPAAFGSDGHGAAMKGNPPSSRAVNDAPGCSTGSGGGRDANRTVFDLEIPRQTGCQC